MGDAVVTQKGLKNGGSAEMTHFNPTHRIWAGTNIIPPVYKSIAQKCVISAQLGCWEGFPRHGRVTRPSHPPSGLPP